MYIQMSIRVNHFETLRQRFPVFEDLRAHLESEGVAWIPSDDTNGILVRGKGLHNEMFRSVVWDVNANLPVCVAPFKAKEGLPPIGTPLSSTENFVDGFMINAWVGSDEVLHVATRKKVGGTNKFYSDKTFGELFTECVASTQLKTLDTLKDVLNTLRVEQAATSAFVSFVAQHPAHLIVSRTTRAGLNVVHVGTVSETGYVNLSERSTNWPHAFARLQIPSYPTRIFHTEQDVHELLRRTSVEKGWRWQGLVFKDGHGNRWRLRTPTYTMMRELRGAEALPIDRFFRLRASRQVMDYLKHYWEDRDTFSSYEQALRNKTADVFAAYVDVHKAHAVAFKDLPNELKPAVFMLHVYWRDQLRPKGFKVRAQNVNEVVNSMRNFEKQRLMEAAPYTQVSTHDMNDLPDLIPVISETS